MSYLMRSKLFVPASRPELFAKALASGADAVCFDLEDSVLPARKQEARENLGELLREEIHTTKILMVRVNAVRTGDFEKDLHAMVWPTVSVLVIPKVGDPREVRETAAALAALERKHRLENPIAILPTIESPQGLGLAREIAESDKRVMGLQLGLADLFGTLGIQQDHEGAAQQVRLQLRLAAGAAGVACFDSAFADFRDEEGFAREAVSARSLGFSGKSCIHPSQIAAANRIFSPGVDEIAAARRVVQAAQESGAAGSGAFALDGRMVDLPFVKRAEEIIRLAEEIQAMEMRAARTV